MTMSEMSSANTNTQWWTNLHTTLVFTNVFVSLIVNSGAIPERDLKGRSKMTKLEFYIDWYNQCKEEGFRKLAKELAKRILKGEI